jgi:hypothetical protein
MAISGHKTESVYRRYDIVSSRDLKQAAARMTEYHAEQRSLVTGSDNSGNSAGHDGTALDGKLLN